MTDLAALHDLSGRVAVVTVASLGVHRACPAPSCIAGAILRVDGGVTREV